MDVITKDLGSEFKIMRIWLKMYPCVATVQGVIDTLAKMMDEHPISADNVEEIRVGCRRPAVARRRDHEPNDVASAQISLPFSLALRLLNDNDLSLYMESKSWKDAKVLGLAKKVKSYGSKCEEEQNYNTTMEVKLTDGKTIKAFQQYPPGSPLVIR